MKSLIFSLLALLSLQQFRARSELVTVDVGVFSGNQPVAGLTAADFVLADNGVPQQPELFSIESVPIDVTFLLDDNGSELREAPKIRQSLRESLHRLNPMPGSESRMRLLSFSNKVQQKLDWRSPSEMGDLDRSGGPRFMTATDALALTLMRRESANRRHVVILFTMVGFEGEEPIIQRGKLRDIADRFNGVIHIVSFGRWSSEAFLGVAEATGGQVHRGSVNRIAETFEGIFRSFRASYVLRYVPTGVAREGWHSIDVKLSKPNSNYTVRARKGYFVD